MVELNGVIVGNAGVFGPGSGQMAFPPGPPDGPFSFSDVTSGVITSGFSVNVLFRVPSVDEVNLWLRFPA